MQKLEGRFVFDGADMENGGHSAAVEGGKRKVTDEVRQEGGVDIL